MRVLKQSIFYLIGIVLILLIIKINPHTLIKYSFWIYLTNITLLILVLFIGTKVNGTKAWFNIPLIGTFQPSEFMKIGLILYLSKVIDKQKLVTTKDELLLILKALTITAIPSVITFLEPDTGAVLVYFIITFIMLFSSKIRLRWFITLSLIISIIIGTIFYLYIMKTNKQSIKASGKTK